MATENKIILNFLPVCSGGGLQNALSFINCLDNPKEFIAVVSEGTPIFDACKVVGLDTINIKPGLLNRFFFEVKVRRFFDRATVCFTLFGPPLIGGLGYLYNINGFAYSNILHKDFDFWWWCSPLEKIKKKLIDVYRARITALSDEIIFETDLLHDKAKSDPLFNCKKLHVVHMAPSKLVSQFSGSKVRNVNVDHGLYNVLYLSGDHPNKRVSDLPKVAACLASHNIKICFVTTLPDGVMLSLIEKQAHALGVSEYFNNLGPIPQAEIGTTINSVNAMINVAYLESFSNNVVEAWALGKPLIITDAEWARRSCHDAALYLDIDNKASIVGSFKSLLDKSIQTKLVKEGFKMLNKMPTAEEKNGRYFAIIKGAKRCSNR